MKKLIITMLAVIFLIGCFNGNAEFNRELDRLEAANQNKAYECADYGYFSALAGRTHEEMIKELEKIIGKKEASK